MSVRLAQTPPGTRLADLFGDPLRKAMPKLTEAEVKAVEAELSALAAGDYPGPLLADARALARAVPERVYTDSADVLLRMHEIAGSGNHQSNLSSLAMVRACFELGLVDSNSTAELIVGRGHIAPAFYAEWYVRGQLPFAPLALLHRGLTGVINAELGFTNTMRYSLGVGVAQAVSIAHGLAKRGDTRKVVCLAGDGEFQEGVVFESLRFAHDAGLDNLVVVLDVNNMGIEPLAGPLSRTYLSAYFDRLTEVDGLDEESVREALGDALDKRGSVALVCQTRKESHSFKPRNAPPKAPSFAGTSGALLAAHPGLRERELAVFTADMAARFGLKGNVDYTNTGLAETINVGLTLGLPRDTVKVLATDAMYYMDSLSMLTEATTSVHNLLVLAGRSWAAWGGAHNAHNMMRLLLNTRVYEPITPAEFHACVDHLLANPETAHVLSAVDLPIAPPVADCSADINGGVWLTPPTARRADVAVVSFGYASTLVAQANEELGLPHLHCAALDPELSPELLVRLASHRRVLAVEYNGVQGGFGEGLRAKYLLPAEVIGVRNDIATVVHDQQIRLHGMAPDQLRAALAFAARDYREAA
ncbi:transketolase [Crossiella equi]|uniref:Transketolase n=1 Tax=Crossiella equi TaxID=130796 RepID=A0ABS5ASG4_9PSEU|nr:1-deoxy-D-xylulose-5-phosphate synthase N-terminal domain-containing protein [Crossiella equi]MBP2478630.1 transketolase [Crossiella equi]